MSKKTLKTNDIIAIGNDILAKSTEGQDFRQGVIALLKAILNDADSNTGVRYLTKDEVPVGWLPGILMGESDRMLPHEERFVGTDCTRISFHKLPE